MKKLIGTLLMLAMVATNVAFAAPTLDAGVEADAVSGGGISAELMETVVWKPGLNMFTGTTEAATFDNDTVVPSGIEATNGTLTIAQNPNKTEGDNALCLTSISGDSAKYPRINIVVNSAIEQARPVQASVVCYKTMDTSGTGTDAENLWLMAGNASKDETWRKFSVNKSVTIDKRELKIATADTTKWGIQAKLNANAGTYSYYFDDISFVPYYKVTYIYNDDVTANKSEYVLPEDATFIPTEAPTREGYIFEGWSTDINATSVVTSIPLNHEDITLYAKWRSESAPVVYFEDFERFEIGQTITSEDVTGFTITGTAVIQADENGNKYLNLTGNWHKIVTDVKVAGVAGQRFMKFDYSAPGTTNGTQNGWGYTDVAWDNTGKAWTGANWSEIFHSYSVAADDATALTYQVRTNSAGFTKSYFDNIYVWYIPEGSTETVTTTFVNSTKSAPATITLPQAVTNGVYAQTAKDASGYVIDLTAITPTEYPDAYSFVGWSYTDGGAPITVGTSSFEPIMNQTLYAVWEDLTKAENFKITAHQIRDAATYPGLRFLALINCATATQADQYGFIVTADEFLTDITADNFEMGSLEKMLIGYAKSTKDGTEIVYDENGTKADTGVTQGVNKAITAVITGLDDTTKAKNFVVRPFFVIDNTTYYGAPSTAKYNDYVTNE